MKRVEKVAKQYLELAEGNENLAQRNLVEAMRCDSKLLWEAVQPQIDGIAAAIIKNVRPAGAKSPPERRTTRASATSTKTNPPVPRAKERPTPQAQHMGLRRMARANANYLALEISPNVPLRDAKAPQLIEAADHAEKIGAWLRMIARAMPDSKKKVSDVFTNERLANLWFRAGLLDG